MGVLTYSVPRALLRRSARQYDGLSLTRKRQIATETDRAVSKPTKDGIPTSTSDNGDPWRFWHRLRPPYRLVRAYGKAQRKRPYTTQVGSLVTIWACGDILAQNLEDEEYDHWRTLRHMSIGCMISIPIYKWFIYLGHSFNYASNLRSLATKVIVNQIVFAPLFNTYFFGMQSLLSGDGLVDAWDRIKNTVPTSWINSCKFWPVVTAFNFTYIGPQYRSLFAGLVALGWQAYLSWLNQRAADEEKARRLIETI